MIDMASPDIIMFGCTIFVSIFFRKQVLVVEWPLHEAAWDDPQKPALVRMEVFRIFISDGTRNCFISWLGGLSSWLPAAFIDAERAKIKEHIEDFGIVSNQLDSLRVIGRQLEESIWQVSHKKVTPLTAGVLLRSSPSYRGLISSFSGLRAKVPEQIPVLPMHLHPNTLISRNLNTLKEPNSLRELAMFCLAFASVDFEDWKVSETKNSRTVWRRKLEGEKVDPFRMTVKVRGADPLALSRLIFSEFFHAKSQKRPKCIQKVSPDLAVYHAVQEGGVLSRDREMLYLNYIKEISSTKALVVSVGLNEHPLVKQDPKAVQISKFLVHICDLDGGADVKLTVCGLSGGFSDSEVRNLNKNWSAFASFVSDTTEGRKALNDMRASINREALDDILSSITSMDEDFLRRRSEVFASVISEVAVLKGSRESTARSPPPSEGGFSVVTSIATTTRKMRTRPSTLDA